MIMDISGWWTGTIIFGKRYGEFRNKELYFNLELTQKNKKISGTATDIGGIGINPDPATVRGYISGNKIKFIKQYASHHIFENGTVKINKTEKGPEIKYNGTYNDADNTFSGHWKIIVKGWLFGIVPLTITNGKGTWQMKRK